MKIAFYIMSALTLILGIVILAYSRSTIGEIEASVSFLISSLFLVGAGILGSINSLDKKLSNNKAD